MIAPADPFSEPSHESARLRRATWAGLLVVLGVGLLLYVWSGISSRQRIAEATTALEEGRVDDAEGLIARVLQARPDSAEAAYLSARLAFARKKPDDVLPL